MPTINFNIDDLKDLSGQLLTKDALIDILSYLKCETESVTESVVVAEVTSDRPDLFSCEGLSRGVRSFVSGCGRYDMQESGKAPIKLLVDRSVSAIRPFIVASALFDVSLSDEALKQIMQLQEKLHNTYGSKRRKSSIGVYDLDKVCPPFTYEAVQSSKISFIPLDETVRMDGAEILEKTAKGAEYADLVKNFDKFPLLKDSQNTILSMPPIINSENTRVVKESRNLLIDVTGTDEKTINSCLNIMVTSILERGGSIGKVDAIYRNRNVVTPKLEKTKMTLSLSTVSSVSGLDLEPEKIISLLNRMGFEADRCSGGVCVAIPPFRIDIMHEVDLVEDIVMAYGLNNIKPEYPMVATIGKNLKGSKIRQKIRDLMVGMGFQEISTYMLSSKEVASKSQADQGCHVEIIQPISSEYSILRGALIPKLLQFLGKNTHIAYPQKIFEYGDVVRVDAGIPVTCTHMAASISDHKLSFEEIQAVAVALLKNLSKEATFAACTKDPLIEGRAAKIFAEKRELGVIGEVTPGVLLRFGIDSPVVLMEIDLSGL